MAMFSSLCISQLAPVVALAWRKTNSSMPSTLSRRGSKRGIAAAQLLKRAAASPWQGAQAKPEEASRLGLGSAPLSNAPLGGIGGGIEIVARFDRGVTLPGIVDRGREFRGRLQRLQERNDVVDLLLVEEMMRSPGRHDGRGIVDARIVHVVPQPFVVAARIADLRQVRADIAGKIRVAGLTHDVTGEARAAAGAVGDELAAGVGVARDRPLELARLRGRGR